MPTDPVDKPMANNMNKWNSNIFTSHEEDEMYVWKYLPCMNICVQTFTTGLKLCWRKLEEEKKKISRIPKCERTQNVSIKLTQKPLKFKFSGLISCSGKPDPSIPVKCFWNSTFNWQQTWLRIKTLSDVQVVTWLLQQINSLWLLRPLKV